MFPVSEEVPWEHHVAETFCSENAGTTVSESGETTSSKLKSGYGVGKESDQDEKRKQGTRQKKSNLGYGINDRSWKR